jgi:hypothetical protein
MRFKMILAIAAVAVFAVALIASPFLVMFFSDDPKHQWLAWVGWGIMLPVGSAGFTAGFRKYVIRGEPGPVTGMRFRLNRKDRWKP